MCAARFQPADDVDHPRFEFERGQRHVAGLEQSGGDQRDRQGRHDLANLRHQHAA